MITVRTNDVCNVFFPPRDVETCTAVEWAIHQHEDPAPHILKNKIEAGDPTACRRYTTFIDPETLVSLLYKKEE
jgi:hypothetical protein